jgi:predicted metalloprotease with PDZ domain
VGGLCLSAIDIKLLRIDKLKSRLRAAGQTLPAEAIRYTVSMIRSNAHYFDVIMEVPTSGKELRLSMPAWTPGHYFIEDFAKNITEVDAFDAASGRELEVDKTSKNTWSVKLNGSKKVKVQYPVYAFSYTDTASYVDNLHALVNGASVYLYAEEMKGNPVRLKLVPRPDWMVVATGLEKVGDWEFTAPDYDVLVDSPIEVGNQEVRSFETGGAKYEVSMFGDAPVDREKFVGDIRKIVESTTPVFGHVPYKRYVFLVYFNDTAGGGLEHLNSTVCFVPRFRLVPKEEYDLMMGLFSHEFFHAWNVKRMRPKGLGPFDYSAEVHTKSLWIAEGITSYYDDLILRRAGIYSAEEFLDAFAININSMKPLQGSRNQSAEEASFDTWIKYMKQDENSPNVSMSYYTQGAVIGWMLDMVIRKSSRGGKNLDDVMKKVYSGAFLKEGRGYTDEEFEAACVELGGPEAKKVFDARVKGREDVDYDRYLAYAGLKLSAKDEHASEKGFLGVRLGTDGGRTTVKTVLAGSAAEAMGLAVNDEVIGLGGMRVGQDKLSFYVGTMKPGDELRLAIARNGVLMNVGGRVGARLAFEFKIQPLTGATEEQKALFKGWLLADWKPELKYPEYARSPDRKSVLDYV